MLPSRGVDQVSLFDPKLYQINVQFRKTIRLQMLTEQVSLKIYNILQSLEATKWQI